jgi:hypothetical protein
MMKRNHTRLCASAAIAAALALSSTPLLAQVAEAPPPVAPEPVLVIPTTPAAPPAQPTIVLPTELPEITPPPTTVTPPERTTTTTRTERASSPAAPPASRARVERPAEPTPVAATPDVAAAPDVEPATSETAPELAVEPVPPVAASEPAVESSPTGNEDAIWVGLTVIAAIAALVLAIWGFVAIGRRKPVDRKAKAIVERPIVAPAAPQPEPLAQTAVATPPAVAPSVSPIRTASPAPSMAHSGAAVALPRTMPATFEERDALMKRMVAARPDRANPFTSPIQRHHRAKLILQSLGRDFGDTEPWIDLSQYPQNWPELANRKHAAA